MNNVNIIGRVGGDIELRYTPSGKAVTEVNLAVDDGWGENKKTAWLGVTVWGPTAELAARALVKGSRVGFTGRLSQEEWEDKTTGKKQRKTKITCESMHLLDPKRQEQDSAPTSRQQQPSTPTTPANLNDDQDTDKIPF